jgi:YfiH family protein
MARTLFTGRAGGFSVGAFDSFNLGLHVNDDAETVIANRALLTQLFSLDSLIFMNQTHGTNIVEVISADGVTPDADAIFTRTKGIGLAVLTADCIPLLLSSPSMIAAVHVGRRGLLAGIIQKVLTKFPEIERNLISAEIGPSICAECYEVDLATYQQAIEVIPDLATNAQVHQLDLVAGARAILSSHKVSILEHRICTRENDDYFSYRRNEITGRQAGVIAL